MGQEAACNDQAVTRLILEKEEEYSERKRSRQEKVLGFKRIVRKKKKQTKK